VDHPILISQEFEYGRFDHSLILGPKFASNLQSKDGSLLDLSSHFTSPIDWGTIFDLFTRPDFLTNLRWLNRFYFARESAQDYIDMTWRHGQLINEHVRDIMTFSSKDDHMHVGAGTQRSGGVMSYDTYDPIGLTDEARKRDKDVAASVLPQYGSISQQHLSVGALRTGAADTSAGNTAAREVLHYFAKPYQLLAEGNT
jgi:hypothetical protein